MARITDINELLFPVDLYPVYTEIMVKGKNSTIEIPHSKVVVNEKTGKTLGIVSNNYKLVTNTQAIEFGKKCAGELFGSNEVEAIEIFNIDAPSTGSYCHIDLVHKNYSINLWDEENISNVYIPYVRVTNSYNTSRALRFDVGLCRKLCLNGVIFEKETVKFTFSHIKHEIKDDISFDLKKKKIHSLINNFNNYTKNLKNYKISNERSLRIIHLLFNIRKKSDIDFAKSKECEDEYESLINQIEKMLIDYTYHFGENGYSLFNAITDIASHPFNNRYFRKDMNSMQRISGNWMNSFQKKIKNKDFDIEKYIQLLESNPKKNFKNALVIQ